MMRASLWTASLALCVVSTSPQPEGPTPNPCGPGLYLHPTSHICSQCPPGRYGDRSNLTTSDCSGACAAGYYCPAGSTQRQQIACPAGRFGSEPGRGDPSCSGAALAG